MHKTFQPDKFQAGPDAPLIIIAGPCVIEDIHTTRDTAAYLKELTDELDLPLIFKSSFDKANRTSIDSYRGPGMEKGLSILAGIKADLDIPVISDVHAIDQIGPASQVLDVLQISAFLCRQTDFWLRPVRASP